MRIQGAKPNYNVQGLPKVRIGTTASAESFGGGNASSTRNLSNAIGVLGRELVDYEQEKRKKHNDARIQDFINQMHIGGQEEKNRLSSLQGINAKNSPEAMEQWFDNFRSSVEGQIENDYQREAFGSALQAYRTQSIQWATTHRDRQDQVYQYEVLDAANLGIGREGAEDAKTVVDGQSFSLTPDGIAADNARLSMIMENVNKRWDGHAPEFISEKRRQAAAAYHDQKLEGMADSPQDALKYLDRPGVKEAFGGEKSKQLREKYTTKNDNDNLFAQARFIVGDTGTSSVRIMEEAAKLYPNDKKKFDDLVNLADDLNGRISTDNKNQRNAAKQAVWDKWREDGYDPRKMPPEFRDDPDNWEKAIKFAEFMSKVDFENTVPNFGKLDALHARSPQEIRDWLDDGDNYQQLQCWAADRKDEIDRIVKKSRGETTGERTPGFKFDDKVTRNILKNSVDLSGGWLGDETKMDDAVNAAYDLFLMRMGEEKNKGANPKDVYYDLMGEIRSNPELLNKSSLDYRKSVAEADTDSPRTESKNPDTGITEITIRDSETGTVQTFEKMGEAELRFSFDIDVRDGMRVPVDAPPGRYKGLDYQPGDIIMNARDRRPGHGDVTLIYDSNFKLRSGGGKGIPARRGDAPLPPEKKPEPPKSPVMLNWEKKHNSKFVWQPILGYFVADAKDENGSGMVQYMTLGPGDAISFIPGAPTDEDAYPTEKPGAEILEAIATLEAEVATLARDPRARKDVEYDKRQEIERLKTAYDRIQERQGK